MVSGVLLGSRYAKQAMVGCQGYGYSRDGGIGTIPLVALGLFNGTPIWLPHASILFRWDASGVVGWGAAVWLHPEDPAPTARAGGYWEGEVLTRATRKRRRAC